MYDHNYTRAVELGYDEAIATTMHNNSAIVPCYARDFNRSQYYSTMTIEVIWYASKHYEMILTDTGKKNKLRNA